MKKRTIILAVLNFVLPLCAFAQLTVQETGKVEIGQEQDMSSITPANRDTVTTLKLYGTGANGANSRVSFGNATSINELNVMVGELPGGDTDRLWLHGKNGLRYTAGSTANHTIFSYDMTGNGVFTFNTGVATPGLVLLVNDSLSIHEGSAGEIHGALDALNAEKFKVNGRTQYGFLLEEVKEVLPELVVSDKNGNCGIDYISCIPLLVNAIKELKMEVQKLKAPEKAPIKGGASTYSSDVFSDGTPAKLFQNTPNPFNSATTIRYSLPEEISTAHIYIYDLQGKQVMSIPVNERGISQVEITASGLQAGMYIYTLVGDGQEIDSKRMILTK